MIAPKLQPFDYDGVRLLPSRFRAQVERAREVYGAIPNDDILKGFRRNAGLPAPGQNMRGWCSQTSSVIEGTSETMRAEAFARSCSAPAASRHMPQPGPRIARRGERGTFAGAMLRRSDYDAAADARDDDRKQRRRCYFPRSLRASSTSWPTISINLSVLPARRAEVRYLPSTTILGTPLIP